MLAHVCFVQLIAELREIIQCCTTCGSRKLVARHGASCSLFAVAVHWANLLVRLECFTLFTGVHVRRLCRRLLLGTSVRSAVGCSASRRTSVLHNVCFTAVGRVTLGFALFVCSCSPVCSESVEFASRMIPLGRNVCLTVVGRVAQGFAFCID